MTDLDTFKEILAEKGVSLPIEQVETFRDLIDTQADAIFDAWFESLHMESDVE